MDDNIPQDTGKYISEAEDMGVPNTFYNSNSDDSKGTNAKESNCDSLLKDCIDCYGIKCTEYYKNTFWFYSNSNNHEINVYVNPKYQRTANRFWHVLCYLIEFY